MTKRLRGAQEDEYRFFTASGVPNPQQRGEVGDGVVIPFPVFSVGSLITVRANINVPDVAPLGVYETVLFPFHNAIGASILPTGFVAFGVLFLMGNELGAPPPGKSGGVSGRLGLTQTTAGADGQYIFISSTQSLTPFFRQTVSSFLPGDSSTAFRPICLGVNSYNQASGLPFTELNFFLQNMHASDTVQAGIVRVVLLGTEF